MTEYMISNPCVLFLKKLNTNAAWNNDFTSPIITAPQCALYKPRDYTDPRGSPSESLSYCLYPARIPAHSNNLSNVTQSLWGPGRGVGAGECSPWDLTWEI